MIHANTLTNVVGVSILNETKVSSSALNVVTVVVLVNSQTGVLKCGLKLVGFLF